MAELGPHVIITRVPTLHTVGMCDCIVLAESSSSGLPSGGTMNMENMCMAFENRCLGYTTTKPKLPLLLVTGFLGSGKTTLLRHLLCNKSNLRMAVLGKWNVMHMYALAFWTRH